MEHIQLDPGELDKFLAIAGKPLWDKWVADLESKGQPGQKILDELVRVQNSFK
jgi:hypothetical protein